MRSFQLARCDVQLATFDLNTTVLNYIDTRRSSTLENLSYALHVSA
jgi:hypothetical protein